MQWAEGILRELALVLLERDLGLRVPDLALLVRKILPGETDDLGQCAVIGLDLGGDMLVLDEGGAEEDEGVRGAGNMVLGLLLRVRGAAGSSAAFARGEEKRLRVGLRRTRGIVERAGGDIRGERDACRGGGEID